MSDERLEQYFQIANEMAQALHELEHHAPKRYLCRIGWCDRWTPEKWAKAEPAPK